MSHFDISAITTREELNSIEHDWNRLGVQSPFQNSSWLYTWWDNFGSSSSEELFTLVARDVRHQVLGIVPWHLHESKVRGRVLRFLGSGEIATDFLGLFCQPEHHTKVAESVFKYLTSQDSQNRWDLIDLDGVPSKEQSVLALTNLFQENDFPVYIQNEPKTWRLNLPDSWEDYLATLSKGGRRKLRSLVAKYFDAGRIHLQQANQHNLESIFETFIRLHQQRQHQNGNKSCFENNSCKDFLLSAARSFLLRDKLLLNLLEIDGQVAGGSFGIVDGGVYYLYQSCANPKLLSHQPGFLMNIHNIRNAKHLGYSAIDFLRGDERYKTKLRSQPSPTIRVRISGKSIASRMRFHAWMLGANTKKLVTDPVVAPTA